VAGGHSIDTLEPIYGLVALGLVHPDKVKRNDRAKPHDVLVLGKPLGVGILSAVLKKGNLSPAGYRQMLDTATQLNTAGPRLAELPGVHAMTDVTGFGLAGHLLEILRGSRLAAAVRFDDLPLLPEALEWAKQGTVTGASARNWESYGHEVTLPAGFSEWKRNLISDPQTSGGLLIACEPSAEAAVLQIFRDEGFGAACRIGTLAAGKSLLTVA
jgi:selenide,water dikinase